MLITMSSLAASAQEQRIRVGFSAMSGSMAWLWTTKEGGYFEQHGLKVDLVYVGGTAQLFQSMLAGEIAFGIGGGPAIIHANAQRRTIISSSSSSSKQQAARRRRRRRRAAAAAARGRGGGGGAAPPPRARARAARGGGGGGAAARRGGGERAAAARGGGGGSSSSR